MIRCQKMNAQREFVDCPAFAAQAAEIERLTRERDEWREKNARNIQVAANEALARSETAFLLEAAEAERDRLRAALRLIGKKPRVYCRDGHEEAVLLARAELRWDAG